LGSALVCVVVGGAYSFQLPLRSATGSPGFAPSMLDVVYPRELVLRPQAIFGVRGKV
jgi:hypothetical protein